jgi:DNA/RNA-binding domain of Phe-tRNA-synthetase-like protein
VKALSYRIAAEIFQRFPSYVRGVVVAHGVENGPSPDDLSRLLREAEASVRDRLRLEDLAGHPRVRCWRDAYRAFGAKPSEFRSSIEAMARRVLRGEALPSINALVDLGNMVSLRHLVPAGAHAIDVLAGDIELRPATGRERFIPMGAQQQEHPLPGEVIFTEDDRVLTRRWTWRQATHTVTLPGTRAILFNVDGLPPVQPEEIEAACQELMELVVRFCGGQARRELLCRERPRMDLNPPHGLA